MTLIQARESAMQWEDEMTRRGERLRSLLAIVVLAPLMAHACWSQKTVAQTGGKGEVLTPGGPSTGPMGNDAPSDMQANQERLRNTDRQKQLVLDTQKLLTLANELKVEVDKSNKNTLSLDVIRKADEIERLAHTVKEKMKGS